jgi:hypothetical protein
MRSLVVSDHWCDLCFFRHRMRLRIPLSPSCHSPSVVNCTDICITRKIIINNKTKFSLLPLIHLCLITTKEAALFHSLRCISVAFTCAYTCECAWERMRVEGTHCYNRNGMWSQHAASVGGRRRCGAAVCCGRGTTIAMSDGVGVSLFFASTSFCSSPCFSLLFLFHRLLLFWLWCAAWTACPLRTAATHCTYTHIYIYIYPLSGEIGFLFPCKVVEHVTNISSSSPSICYPVGFSGVLCAGFLFLILAVAHTHTRTSCPSSIC